MPTYEYVCNKCGSHFDYFQSISSEPLTECPMEIHENREPCRGPVKRVISGGAGLIFRGSGFYATDYRSPSYQEAAKKEAEGGSGSSETKGSDSGSEGKTDSTQGSSKSDSSGSSGGSSGSTSTE